MAKKTTLTYEQKISNAIYSLPNPIEDKRHSLLIYFIDNRARSNETRFAHIAQKRHKLNVSDILRIPKRINTSIFKKDKERKETYNLYIKRNGYSDDQYIKLSLSIEDKNPCRGVVKTIFITERIK